ncbi:uncharacterized protein [Haliotis cracherodii]|uniref:uncharacterized protein n=1 Tax=Haliotis cracherodii TaxID=6455 RepID=UPI0039E99EA7
MGMDVPLTIVLMACVFTTNTKGSNSLQLTSSPATASPGQPYTLMCSSSGGGSRTRAWYWRNDVIFRTRYVSDTQCAVDVSNNDVYNHLSGRINVTCSHNQHKVTLRILTGIDNGSVWLCADSQSGKESNRLTIHVVNLMTTSSTTTTASTSAATANSTTTTTTTTTTNDDISSSTSLQEGADEASAPNIYTSPSHYEDMGHQYGKVERQYVNTVEGIGGGSLDSMNKEGQAANAAYYNTAGQHQHLDQHANTGDTTYYNTTCDADN